MHAPRRPDQTARVMLLSTLLGLLLSADAHSHAQEQLHRPEALLRRAWFSLSPADWVRRQRLQAAREHRLPADFSSCSTLQGPSCLTSAEQPVTLNWGDLEELLEDSRPGKPRQPPVVKLLLIKSKLGGSLKQAVNDVLQEQATAPTDAASSGQADPVAQAAEAVLGKHAQTVYEGDPTMPPDMDVIMANIANAIGIEPEGSAAEAIKKELVRALTDSEFAAAEAQTADEDADGAPPQAAEKIDVELDDLESSSTSAATEQTVITAHSGVRQSRLILGPSPQPSHAGSSGASPTAATTAAAPAGQQEQGRTLLHQAAPQPRADDAAPLQRPGVRQPESANAAAKRPAGRRHTTSMRPDRSRSERSGGEEADSSIVEQHELRSIVDGAAIATIDDAVLDSEPAWPDEADLHPDDIGNRIYADETGRTFILDDPLPGDEHLSSGERVYYDDNGVRYVVDDEKQRVRKDDIQMTALPDDMAWLDGLSDEEYDAYWDEVEREEAALAAEEEDRQWREDQKQKRPVN